MVFCDAGQSTMQISYTAYYTNDVKEVLRNCIVANCSLLPLVKLQHYYWNHDATVLLWWFSTIRQFG